METVVDIRPDNLAFVENLPLTELSSSGYIGNTERSLAEDVNHED